MATHLIFDLQGTPHLATETPDGFLTQSGIFANSNVRFACPVGELEKRATRFGAGDEVFNTFTAKAEIVLSVRMPRQYPILTQSDCFTEDGRCHRLSPGPDIIHLSEAQRLGLIPRTDDTKTPD